MARPVDGASVAVLRIGLALSVAWILWGFIAAGGDGRSGIERLYTGHDTRWHFPYPGLKWLRPLPEPGTTGLFYLAFGAALLVAGGWFYPTARCILLAAFSYIWLMDASLYGNHFPLAWVFLVCLALVPGANAWSLDAWRARRRGREWPATIPWWSVLLLRVQTGLVYFYGGVAKLHADWLGGEPLRSWLAVPEMVAPVERAFGPTAAARVHEWFATEGAAYFFSYGGLAFDLSIPFLLAWRKSRAPALLVAVAFHLFNYFFIAHVGIVALMALWVTLIFCRPDWPRRWIRWTRRGDPAAATSAASTPLSVSRFVAVAAWLVFQVVWPLRHFAIAGDAYWTDEGTRASWFLMTRNKTGRLAQFRVVDPAIRATPSTHGFSIDWSVWKGMRPPVEIFDVDARTIDWSKAPELFATYEPLVGERIFFNPQAAGLSTLGASQARVDEIWRDRFGRQPRLAPTEHLPRLLDELAADSIAAARSKQPEAVAYVRRLAAARALEKRLSAGGLDETAWRETYLDMIDAFAGIAADPRHRQRFLGALARAAPLALQGNSAEGFRPLLLDDPGLIAAGHAVVWRVYREAWRGALPTYSDLRYLEARWLIDLPSVVAVVDGQGRVTFLWNYTHELNAHQIQALQILPPLAGPLAEHIADWWQATQGRRPQVYGQALMVLNRRPPRPAFDATIDILAEPYRVLRHNRWIRPAPE